MREFLKKSLAMLPALVMCASLLPLSAFAETEEQLTETEQVSAEAPPEVPAVEELPEATEEPQVIEEAPAKEL